MDETKKQEEKEEIVEQTIDQKEDVVESLTKKIQDSLEQLKRTQADFINYKARVLKDTQDLVFLQTKEIALGLIAFKELMLISMKNEERDETKKVLSLLLEKIDNSLSRLNITKIILKDNIPDYNLCECINTINVTNKEDNNKIIEIIEDGYLYNKKLIKPIKVVIGKLEE